MSLLTRGYYGHVERIWVSQVDMCRVFCDVSSLETRAELSSSVNVVRGPCFGGRGAVRDAPPLVYYPNKAWN